MKTIFKKLASRVLWQDKFMLFGVSFAFLLVLMSWLLSAQSELYGDFSPWHYTVYFGIDRIGPWWYILIYPVFASAIFIINTIASMILYFQRRLFSYVIVSTTIVSLLFIFIYVLSLVIFVL